LINISEKKRASLANEASN